MSSVLDLLKFALLNLFPLPTLCLTFTLFYSPPPSTLRSPIFRLSPSNHWSYSPPPSSSSLFYSLHFYLHLRIHQKVICKPRDFCPDPSAERPDHIFYLSIQTQPQIPILPRTLALRSLLSICRHPPFNLYTPRSCSTPHHSPSFDLSSPSYPRRKRK